jgi:hypothetical protein
MILNASPPVDNKQKWPFFILSQTQTLLCHCDFSPLVGGDCNAIDAAISILMPPKRQFVILSENEGSRCLAPAPVAGVHFV